MIKNPHAMHRRTLAATLLTAMLAAASTAYATSDTWIGATDGSWATSTNWSTSPATVPGTGDTATFSESSLDTNGNTTLNLGSGVTLAGLLFDGADAAAYTIGSGVVGSETLTLDNAGAITINAGVTANQTFNSNVQLNSAANATATFTNNGSGTLTIAGTLSANAASGNGVLNVAGSGNTTITGAITDVGAGNSALKKTGSGTLTLSNGSTFNGTGASQSLGAGTGGNTAFTGPMIVQEGTLLLNGGTHTVTGEAVIGGISGVHGGAGQNAKIQIDSGALNVSGYLSVGRGNGVGGVSSDLVLNNAATVTAANLSAGYNGGSGSNLPKGTLTLNNSSNLTISGNGTFNLAESAGSNMTTTLNDSATLTVSGSGNKFIGNAGTGTLTLNGTSSANLGTGLIAIGQQNGSGTLNVNTGATFTSNSEIRVAYSGGNGGFSGSGTINVNGGTLNTNALTLSRNNNDVASTLNATVNVSNGGTLNVKSATSLIGWRGIGTNSAVNISGGSYNQGTTALANMSIGSFTGTNAAVTVSGGALTFQNNSNLRFADTAGANASTRTLTISGGNVTFYSDAGATVGGTGTIDLMLAANASGTNTINLNGGTLTANQIKATSATGTRVINFNGGTLKTASSGLASTFLASGVATTANVRAGGAIFDTNGINTTIGQSLVHETALGVTADGGLTKNGLGTLTLSGANTYTGGTVVNAGTLASANSFSMAGANRISVAATGTAGTDYATMTSTSGTLTFGGTLDINLTASLSGGESFNLIQASGGALAGDFSGVSISGSYIASLTDNSGVWTGSGSGYDFSFSEASGVLSVVTSAIPEPSTYAAILGALTLGAAALRRRRPSGRA